MEAGKLEHLIYISFAIIESIISRLKGCLPLSADPFCLMAIPEWPNFISLDLVPFKLFTTCIPSDQLVQVRKQLIVCFIEQLELSTGLGFGLVNTDLSIGDIGESSTDGVLFADGIWGTRCGEGKQPICFNNVEVGWNWVGRD